MLHVAESTSMPETLNMQLNASMKPKVLVSLARALEYPKSVKCFFVDTADRFLNCKCCRYLIRDGRMEQAEEMAKQFTRENITLQENLKEMQVLWFQAESAESYYRQGKSITKFLISVKSITFDRKLWIGAEKML